MNESEKQKTQTKMRKPYQKPRMRRVELRPQEAVLGACKAASGTVGGGAGGTCSTISCQSTGS
ncbi:MAG TPA: hypothetical protein VGO91_09455 [Pyrinomonadaceae bacterium]|jgi:hypothetical protein|nr:hypothetical protein [Pyrinomonadaceae bacterium]